jgi:hypothetical protein
MQTILLTASINKLSVTRHEAEDYAALIMESVDNKNKGYIEVLLYIFVIQSVEISHYIYIYILNRCSNLRHSTYLF